MDTFSGPGQFLMELADNHIHALFVLFSVRRSCCPFQIVNCREQGFEHFASAELAELFLFLLGTPFVIGVFRQHALILIFGLAKLLLGFLQFLPREVLRRNWAICRGKNAPD